MRRVATALALLIVAVLPQTAQAHSLVRPGGAVISYLSQDATSLNTLTVGPSAGRIEFTDPTVDGGIDPGGCTPGTVSGGFITQAFCPASGVARVRIDLGEREDTATVSLAIPVTILGGPGADRLTGGAAADELSGGDGNDGLGGGDGDDTIDGELGIDDLDGGSGADRLLTRDGLADVVRCGDGADVVDADALDEVAADCEAVSRTATEAPVGSGGDEPGRPSLEVGAETVQRPGASRRVRVYASSSEPGAVSASGFVEIAGLLLPLKTDRRRVRVGGAGVALTAKLSRKRWGQARRALQRGQRVIVRLGVVATDVAGNSSKRDAPPVRLAPGEGAGVGSAARPARHPEPGDMDGDEVWDWNDNCPTVKNGSQIDTDGDDEGDACDADDDDDGVPDTDDNCRIDPNPDQADGDGDGYGDACPPVDSDGDAIINDDDNCDLDPNPDQEDLDGDDRGDVCDRDVDGDDFDNAYDNCPTVYNLEPNDVDGDGLINDQLDRDGDGIGTACDPDESVIPPPGPAPDPDHDPPGGGVLAGRNQTLAQLRAGMIVRIRCSEACAATAEVILDRRTARRLGLGRRRIVASGSARLDGAGRTYAFSRLDPRAGRALAKGGGVRAKLSTTVVDDAGNARRLARRIELRG